MKVVLIKDVPNLGKAGTVKDISDGYAKNYLFPHKLAAPSGSVATHEVKAKIAAKQAKRTKELEELRETAKQLTGKSIIIPSKSGTNGRLFGRITDNDIAQAINESLNYTVDKRKISLSKPIRHLGRHEVILKFGHGISCNLSIDVVAEEAA